MPHSVGPNSSRRCWIACSPAWARAKLAKERRWRCWPMNDVAVIGAGAWGSALAMQAARAGRGVVLWARDPARIAASLPATITRTATLPSAQVLLLAVPLQHLRAIATALPHGGPLICAAKGIEAGTLALPLEILAQTQP